MSWPLLQRSRRIGFGEGNPLTLSHPHQGAQRAAKEAVGARFGNGNDLTGSGIDDLDTAIAGILEAQASGCARRRCSESPGEAGKPPSLAAPTTRMAAQTKARTPASGSFGKRMSTRCCMICISSGGNGIGWITAVRRALPAGPAPADPPMPTPASWQPDRHPQWPAALVAVR